MISYLKFKMFKYDNFYSTSLRNLQRFLIFFLKFFDIIQKVMLRNERDRNEYIFENSYLDRCIDLEMNYNLYLVKKIKLRRTIFWSVSFNHNYANYYSSQIQFVFLNYLSALIFSFQFFRRDSFVRSLLGKWIFHVNVLYKDMCSSF